MLAGSLRRSKKYDSGMDSSDRDDGFFGLADYFSHLDNRTLRTIFFVAAWCVPPPP